MRDESPTKKKRVNYWGAETEAAIIEFNQTQDQESRDRIYAEKLHAPFCKLVENIVNRFKFPYIGESYQSIHNDALGHLVKNIHQFSPSKGKSFGYASIVVKNYLIQRNNDHYKRHNREVPVVEYDDPEYEESVRASNDVALLSYEAPSYDVKEFFRLLVDWWEVNLSKVFDYDYERTIAKAVLQTMADIPELDPQGRGGTGRRELYKELRNLTGKRTQHIGRVVGIMAKQYPKLQQRYLANGYLLKERKKRKSLTTNAIVAIREEYAKGKTSTHNLAKVYDVSSQTIKRAIRGEMGGGRNLAFTYRGERCHLSKITEHQAREIFQKHWTEQKRCSELAAEYGIKQATVWEICHRRTWKMATVDLKDLMKPKEMTPPQAVSASLDTDQSTSESVLVSA